MPFTEPPGTLAQYRSWWVGKGGNWRELKVLECTARGANLLALFEGCENPETAAEFRGNEVGLPRESLPSPAENEFYQADLIGLEVVNLRGERLGNLAGLFENGAHAVARVTDGGCERLLPLVPSVVKEVDLGAGRMSVEWELDW